MASPGYATYTPKRHHSSASSISSLQQLGGPSTPPHHGPSPLGASSPSSRTLGGHARSQSHTMDSGSFLRAPQPSRPALPAQWSGLSSSSAISSGAPPPAASALAAGASPAPRSHASTATPNAARSPPCPRASAGSPASGAPTPPPSTFPFAGVPPGQSPFPSASPMPDRVRSPDKGPAPYVPQASSGAAAGAGSGGGGPRRMPYQAGFQPQGVRRDRSDAFFEQRKRCSEARKLDEGRLARRLEKLVALHFPPDEEKDKAGAQAKGSPLASLSSLGDSLRGRTAKELWRTAVGNVDVDVERAEQAIVKWQDDKDATHCPICTAAFGVRVRRHHCRLCGRVVCFLPPTPLSQYPEPLSSPPSPDDEPSPTPTPVPKPVRRERCSTFFTHETRVLGEEKKRMGVVVEVPPVEQDLSIDAVLGPSQGAPKKEKDERKKVRVCRECLGTVLRQQLKTLPVRTPTWLKLYDVLVQLEKEIDETLPEFQELAVVLSNPAAAAESSTPPSANHAKTLRKRLLTDLASYDTVSKRIRDLPLPEGAPPGGSQDRLQRALAARGQLYLSEKLGLLRSLGNVEELSGAKAAAKGKKKKVHEAGKDGEYTVKTLASLLDKDDVDRVTEKVGPELEAAAKLNVLREQEALVKSYVDDANSRRQFEDAAALQASLEELRAEIAAVSASLP